MKIAFFSNYLNHHQLPLCKELLAMDDISFNFVATNNVSKARMALGYTDMNQEPFVIRAYENKQQKLQALALCEECDVMIIGSAPEEYAQIRIQSGKLMFRYSERIFRREWIRRFSPRTLRNMWRNHVRHRQKPVYLLCASAYTAADFQSMGAYNKKTYKWGYFPEVKEYDGLQALLDHKRPNSILWVSRFIELKHPEYVLEVATRLKKENIPFIIEMIGIGKLEEQIRQQIRQYGLEDQVVMIGAMSSQEVRQHMEQSELFLFTSDFREGWGAVLNEAMNSACAVVASHAIGAAPFLVKHCENGMIYRNGDVDNLYEQVKALLLDGNKRRVLQKNAYQTIVEEWNPRTAARRLVSISSQLLKTGQYDAFASGPCSRAEKLKNNWF